jgi:hypothetical protein
MLRSNPNAKSKKWFGTRNKLEIRNKSNYDVNNNRFSTGGHVCG